MSNTHQKETNSQTRNKQKKFYIAQKLYPDLKRALVDRGWTESTSKNAKANLKFEYKANDNGN